MCNVAISYGGDIKGYLIRIIGIYWGRCEINEDYICTIFDYVFYCCDCGMGVTRFDRVKLVNPFNLKITSIIKLKWCEKISRPIYKIDADFAKID